MNMQMSETYWIIEFSQKYVDEVRRKQKSERKVTDTLRKFRKEINLNYPEFNHGKFIKDRKEAEEKYKEYRRLWPGKFILTEGFDFIF